MIFGEQDQKIYNESTHCHICDLPLTPQDEKNRTVRDHCHYTGKFRGAAHNSCNLRYRKPKFYPVYFHNLAGYDAHLFIKNLGKTEGKIDCIPNNEEKYISFSKQIKVDTFVNQQQKLVEVKREIRFLDTFKFMATSLAKLIENLNEFSEIKKFYKDDLLKLLLRKGVYPYDFVNSLERLNDTSLPPKEAFYSKLNDEHISDSDYEHAQKVWKTFGIQSMREYHNLYLQSDVLLLADVFESFRGVCMKNYGLDPSWYYTAPGLSYDAMLKKTKVELQLLHDVDMLLMVEKGIRGGVSMITTRHSKANNKYMKEYDSESPSKFIFYTDANNLYGGAMSECLPTDGFEWMTTEELGNWRNIPCILEVDLEYPRDLHNLHNDYPLAPQRVLLGKVEKLVPNLYDKPKYIAHHKILKQYEDLGLKITWIHRGIKFNESPFMKQYIDLNTQLRTAAANDFEKDFFKLMNNSVFGKTMENIRNRVDVQLVNEEKKARKLVSKPNYDRCTIFDENLIAIHMKRTKLVFNKPVYLGMSILDISKTIMYDFHYHYIKPKFEDRAKLLFTDTDSLAYEIQTEDLYKDISSDVDRMFDTSNFSPNHPSGIKTGVNKKVIGKFKDEAGGKQITEFVGLRAKLYAYKIEEKEEKKCKGIKKSVVKKTITLDNYKKCLFDQQPQMRTMNVIRSRGHQLFTEEINKIALAANDDKRIILDDHIHTLAHGFGN